MRQLNGRYAQRFNRRHRRVGHLFQGRYTALLVERGPHLLEACRYTVLNPARTRKPRRYDTYPWSSYRATAGLEPAPPCLELDRLLDQFAPDRRLAHRRYRAFIRAGLNQRQLLQAATSELYLAERPYIRRLADETTALAEIPRAQREPIAHTLERLLQAENGQALANAYREHGYTLREIATALNLHYSPISRCLAAHEQSATHRRPLRRKT